MFAQTMLVNLSRGDLNLGRFLILPTGQFKHLLSEGFFTLRRQIGTQNTQACPYGFDTLTGGNLDSCPFLGTQMAISTHGRHTPLTTQKIFIRAAAVAFDAC